MRNLLTLSLGLVLGLTASCIVGESGPLGTGGPTGGGAGPDAGIGGASPDAAAAGSPDAPAGPACVNKVPNVGNGHHNAGTDCMNGCHNHGFTIAGTIYAAAGGGTPMVGATITIKDAANNLIPVVSQSNGNFYTSAAVQFPITISASSCPAITPMVSPAQSGACNKGGCHDGGATGRIHLP